ncbi:EpsG family protein [Avibacterium paragallinarum]
MNFKILKSECQSVFIISFLILIISFFVALRDLSIGADAYQYKSYFDNFNYYINSPFYELGYHYFIYIIHAFTDNYFFFLFFYFLFTNFILFKIIYNFKEQYDSKYFLFTGLIFLSFLFVSSWYETAILNGIRQGTSLAIFYLATTYNYNKKNILFLFLFIFSCFFHSSSFLLLPFLILFFIGFRKVLYIFLILALFYPLGITENLVIFLSNFMNIPIYSTLAEYAEDVEAWKGFQLNFYVYTIFWALFFYVIHKFLIKSELTEFVLKTYLILCSFYFFYGFGNFSNRFGFVCWFYLPIAQTVFTYFLFKKYVRNHNILLIFILSFLFFSYTRFIDILGFLI